MGDNPFTSPSISGYNTSPPADDGTQVSSNEITWAKHKAKLADPVKTLAESTVSNTSTAFDSIANTGADQNNQFAGSIAFASSSKTIASGAFTATRTNHTVRSQGGAGSDNLDTITTSSVSDGAILILSAGSGSETIVCKHEATAGAGDLHLADDSDFSLDDTEKRIIFLRDGADWYEIARSVNNVPFALYVLEQSDGTDGGTATSGSYTKITITEDTDTGGFASVSSGVVTLIAGTYEVNAEVCFNAVNGCRIRLRNTTDSSNAAISNTGNAGASAHNVYLPMTGRFTITASKAFELQYFVETTVSTTGLGEDDAITAGTERYVSVELRKIS